MISTSLPGFRPEIGVAAVFIGLAADILDGSAARYLDCKSKFGSAFDQLADLTCFGIGPAIFFARHQLENGGGWFSVVACYFYVGCSVARIARELVVHNIQRPLYFVGIPTNLASPFVVCSVYFFPGANWLPILVIVLSFMMVMNVEIPKGLGIITLTAPEDKED